MFPFVFIYSGIFFYPLFCYYIFKYPLIELCLSSISHFPKFISQSWCVSLIPCITGLLM
ncbi:unnamed protein product [Spirodela intermedia]|uniref:Uncharacterized protein n=1 Tax=Spirodela intermedia TaxID=51605 RepID=A0A7I8LD31_SPIIN|nr:unnamed protein product [Spirodela intermedia]